MNIFALILHLPKPTSDEQDRQQEVRKQRGEVDHLASPPDSLPDAEVAQHPHQQQRAGQLPADVADVLDAAGDLEGSAPEDDKTQRLAGNKKNIF